MALLFIFAALAILRGEGSRIIRLSRRVVSALGSETDLGLRTPGSASGSYTS